MSVTFSTYFQQFDITAKTNDFKIALGNVKIIVNNCISENNCYSSLLGTEIQKQLRKELPFPTMSVNVLKKK